MTARHWHWQSADRVVTGHDPIETGPEYRSLSRVALLKPCFCVCVWAPAPTASQAEAELQVQPEEPELERPYCHCQCAGVRQCHNVPTLPMPVAILSRLQVSESDSETRIAGTNIWVRTLVVSQ